MKNNIKISPSILSADYGNLLEECLQAEKGKANEIHIDIMDGHYVHNYSFGSGIIPALKKRLKISLVAHLEIDNPDVFIEDFAQAGSSMIVVQEDTCPNLPLTIKNIKKSGAQAGIGINPDRGFEKIEANPEILNYIDLLIIMAVYPGFGGQPFSPVTIPKVEQAYKMKKRYGVEFDIGVDGGVNEETIPFIVKAGGNYLIAGSSVFNEKGIINNIKKLQLIAEKALIQA